jgi:hypothetical protein
LLVRSLQSQRSHAPKNFPSIAAKNETQWSRTHSDCQTATIVFNQCKTMLFITWRCLLQSVFRGAGTMTLACLCRYDGGWIFRIFDRCVWRDRTSNGLDRRKAQIAAFSRLSLMSRPQSSVATLALIIAAMEGIFGDMGSLCLEASNGDWWREDRRRDDSLATLSRRSVTIFAGQKCISFGFNILHLLCFCYLR